jgi:hypothetical protein
MSNYPGEESDLKIYLARLATLRERREAYDRNPGDSTYLDMWAAENDKERAWKLIACRRLEHSARKRDFAVRECIDLTLGGID